MKLSAPVYRLKRNARRVSRQKKIPLIQALDEIARQEDCESWSLLVARLSAEAPAARLFGQLRQGDLLLVGARPGHGKTLLGLELALEAIKSGSPGNSSVSNMPSRMCWTASAPPGPTTDCSGACSNLTAPTPLAPIT
jgi:replicative DNA helicase